LGRERDRTLMLNRGVVIVRPKQPYREWAEGLDDEGPGLLPDGEGERTIYLIPNFKTDDDAWELLEDLWNEIFESELWDWHTDPSDWPKGRTFEMFQEWFHVEFHSVVKDLWEDETIVDDDE
jgi:hypothetical protein